MFIDHIGASIIEKYLFTMPNYTETKLYSLDIILRLAGRIAFPIFCFLLVEGLLHTRSLKKYAINLFLFALISEIPFDLAFFGSAFYPSYQNVFFTLLIGLFVIKGFTKILEIEKFNKVIKFIINLLIIISGMTVAYLLKTDYSAMGVLTIALMYVFRKRKLLSATIGCLNLTIMSFIEITAFLSLIPIAFYNGERGIKLKYAFYIFYPAHLLLFFIISKIIGI